jgi:hypothetical protein
MKYFRTVLALTVVLATGLALLQSSQATAFNPFQRPVNATANKGKVKPVCVGRATSSPACHNYGLSNPFTGNGGILVKVALLVCWIVGAASVAAILYSGFQFMNSRGDAQKAVTARNTLLYAVVGLLVAMSAQALIAYGLNRLL